MILKIIFQILLLAKYAKWIHLPVEPLEHIDPGVVVAEVLALEGELQHQVRVPAGLGRAHPGDEEGVRRRALVREVADDEGLGVEHVHVPRHVVVVTLERG